MATKAPALKRFLSDNPVEYKKAIQAAETYVSKIDAAGILALYTKPFQNSPGNVEYYRLMYELLNILKIMNLPHQGRILEIGSGPGWITEILLLLGFTVDALEPSEELINIARDRCSALSAHHRQDLVSRVRFYQSTIEEIEFDEDSFHGILCYDVLHHLVDEEKALRKAFRFLKPGGCLGIVEGSWRPDNKALEKALIEEMEEFGTLENPFSREYLDYLLDKFAFVGVARYVPVNGFFSEDQLSDSLEAYSTATIQDSNNLTALKPMIRQQYPECYQFSFPTSANITLISGGITRDTRVADMYIRVQNTGKTIWQSEPTRLGHVVFALRRRSSGQEASHYSSGELLTRTVLPGGTVELSVVLQLPDDAPLDGWELDLLSEGEFWFSSRGTQPCPVPIIS